MRGECIGHAQIVEIATTNICSEIYKLSIAIPVVSICQGRAAYAGDVDNPDSNFFVQSKVTIGDGLLSKLFVCRSGCSEKWAFRGMITQGIRRARKFK